MQIQNETYLPDQTYAHLIKALATVEPCPITGEMDPDRVVELLGEIAGIWPEHARQK